MNRWMLSISLIILMLISVVNVGVCALDENVLVRITFNRVDDFKWTPEYPDDFLQEKNLKIAINNGTYAKDGVIFGDPTFLEGRNEGTAMGFDGQDDKMMLNAKDISNFSEGTISLWLKISSFSISSDRQYIYCSYSNSNDGLYLFLLNNGYLQFDLYSRATNQRFTVSRDITPWVGDGEWHHIFISWKCGEQLRLLLDGGRERVLSLEGLSQVDISGTDWIGIGYDYRAADDRYFFNGAVDELVILDRAVTIEELPNYLRYFKGVLFFPNPFFDQDELRIAFNLDESEEFEIHIYDELGSTIWYTDIISAEAGYNEVCWDGKDKSGTIVPEGIYTCVISQRYEKVGIPISSGILVKSK